jgi:hypothetical protein
LWRELHTSVEVMLAMPEIVATRQLNPAKNFTPQDFDDALSRAFDMSQERFGVLFERIPPDVIKQARRYTRTAWEIGWKVLEWQMTDTMPETGEKAGRCMWGDEAWTSYQVSRRREFVTIFLSWRKGLKLRDDSWLREKDDVAYPSDD